MSGLHVDDVGGVLPAVVELEFINAEDLRSLLRLDKFLAAYGVQLLQPLLVDGFHCVLAQAGDLRHLLVSICSDGEEIPCVLVKLLCHAVTDGFEGDELALRRSAGRTFELVMWEEHAAQVTAEAQMPQYDIRVGVNVHTLPTLAHPVFFLDSQTAAKAEYRASGLRCFCCRFFIFEAVQKRRNPQMFLRLRLKKQLTVGLGAYILHLEEPPLGRSICPGRQYPILADGSSLFNSFARCLYRHPTEKVIDPNISRKMYEAAICARLLAQQSPPVGIYFISEDFYTLASYYQTDMRDTAFLPSPDWKLLPEPSDEREAMVE